MKKLSIIPMILSMFSVFTASAEGVSENVEASQSLNILSPSSLVVILIWALTLVLFYVDYRQNAKGTSRMHMHDHLQMFK